MIDELNRKFKPYREKIERMMNKKCLPFGDLQPGNVYHLPIVCSYQETITEVAFAGMIKDFFLKEEDSQAPIKIKRMIGYAAASRVALDGQESFEKLFKCIFEEIKLTLGKANKAYYTEAGYGYYIKISELKDEENYAAVSFTVESNFIPMVQIGRTSDQRYLRT